jgi:hypothetical protein
MDGLGPVFVSSCASCVAIYHLRRLDRGDDAQDVATPTCRSSLADFQLFQTTEGMAQAGCFDVEHGRRSGELVEKDVRFHSAEDASSTDEPYSHLIYHQHYSSRAPWLRAGVLGANDGLVSVASLMLGRCFGPCVSVRDVARS